MSFGKISWQGVRVGKKQTVSIDGRHFEGLDGAFITTDGKRAFIVLDNLTKSIQVGDIVKLRTHHYTVVAIVPAGKLLPISYVGKGISLKPINKQTYIVADKSIHLRIQAHEITGIIRGDL
jgi:hypothetical protein